jgi:hypothetical protein
MGVLITALLALHGVLHLLGFAKWSRLAAVTQLSGRLLVPLGNTGERVFAAGWLAAFVLLLSAAALRAARPDLWWAVALAGVFVSQGLILVAWPDAKAGTVANVIILLPVIAAAAHARFEKRVDAEAVALLAQAKGDTRVVTQDELRTLPEPVAKWLEASGVVGRPRAATVRLHQRGEIRTKPDAPWMSARAEQYFSIDPPGFVWKVDATMMRAVPIAGRDRYVDGHGQMLIKAASLVNVVEAADEAIDLGAMLRYLAEVIWFPSAALKPYISWEPIDVTHARATIRYAGRSAPAVFTFDGRGRAVRFDAERPLGGGKDAKLTPWFGASSEWRTFEGIEVPTRGEVGWQLPSETFIYYRWEILDVEFNHATREAEGE